MAVWAALSPAVIGGAVLIALAIDRCCGEPPAWLHPVVGMGRFLAAAGRWAAPPAVAEDRSAAARALATMQATTGRSSLGPLLRGVLAWLMGAIVVVAMAGALQALARDWPAWVQAAWLGLWLKPLFAWRLLRDEVTAVEAALAQSLDAGRAQVARLVSRDVDSLDEGAVREAALSTLAENLNDSVVAPLLWFAVLGLPGAALYRFANTADAMWGYLGARHGRDWTWAGRWAARADDVLSWLPARLTALLLAPAWWWGMRWSRLCTESARTPSPNGGWPMAALALTLGVCLRKRGVYALNPSGRPPLPADTPLAIRRCAAVVAVLAAAAAAVVLVAGPTSAISGGQA
ncbi:CobD/CbiB family cobalamin biosynthesis protein [Tepidimonas charontis]|uniref:Cobalamin biosynthesis protein CobD n=1 Tax=Tepidimonas charontis TaxID=2267262 RepID=A0A554XKZ3_9BURK|nr:CobD/CbiB family cobalamin biosynthesis protein [Tepidimonas charontis]TSE36486.1 Cobalamin biosynthesis protein CobD [Tepidimonas charontis]